MKKCISLILALVLVMAPCMAAYATETSEGWIPNYTYDAEDGTTYGKISHPDTAPNSVNTHVDEAVYDGIVDYLGAGQVGISGNNEGDRAQAYPWASASYGKYLYIGTSQSTPATGLNLISQLTGTNKKTMIATMKALFNGRLYFHEEDMDPVTGEYYQPLSVVVKINVEDPTDIEIIHSGVQFRAACVVGDKLYFCGSENIYNRPVVWMFEPENGDKATLLFRGASPATYTTMAERQLDAAIRGICNYNGHCAFSYLDNEEVIPGKKGSGKIYVLKDNDPSGFCVGDEGTNYLAPDYLCEYRCEDVVEIADQADLFDYPCLYYFDSNIGGGIHEMIEFNDYLYVSCVTGTDANGRRPFAVVKAKFDVDDLADCGDELDVEWVSVIGDKEKDGAKYTFGIDPSRTQAVANNIMVFDNHLYIGEYNDQMYSMSRVVAKKDLTVMAKNMEASINLYRLDTEDNVEMIAGDPTDMFPEGGLSGRGSGYGEGFNDLGTHTNVYTWQMIEFDGKLYLGTYDNASCLEPIGQFSNGDILHWNQADWESQINYLLTLLKMAAADSEPTAEAILQAAPLKAEQSQALLQSLGDGELPIAVPNQETLELLAELLAEMLKNAGLLDEEMSENFLEQFQKWMDECQDYLEELELEYPELVALLEDILELLNNEETQANVNAALYMAKLSAAATRGFDFYSSEDGIHFDEISKDGFGDPYNYGVRVYGAQDTLENKWFVAGIANPFYGAQLWKLMNVEPNKGVTVSFDMGGHGTQIEDVTVKEGDPIEKPENPTEEGWNFGGWFVDPECTERYDFSTPVTKSITIYAMWSQEEVPDDPVSPDTGMFLGAEMLFLGAAILTGTSLRKKKED